MPIYQCNTPEGLLSEDQQKDLARKITTLHCDMTGAPKMFVHVAFGTIKAGTCFSGGEHSKVSFIRASWRAGRSQELRQSFLHALAKLWSTETGTDIRNVLVSINEVPASSIMEFGHILPEPEQEKEWYERHGFTESPADAIN